MINLKRVFLFIAFATNAGTALAAEWIVVGGNSKVETSVDIQSLRRSGEKIKVWIKWIYEEPNEAEGIYPRKMYQSAKSLSIYNCAENSSITIQDILYSEKGGGEVIKSVTVTEAKARYSEVVPDSIGEAILQYVCTKSPRSIR